MSPKESTCPALSPNPRPLTRPGAHREPLVIATLPQDLRLPNLQATLRTSGAQAMQEPVLIPLLL